MSELKGNIGLWINDMLMQYGKLLLNCDGFRSPIVKKIINIRKEGRLLLNYQEAIVLYTSVLGTAKIQGSCAEVGVYTGGSAKLICEAKRDKDIFLFDTFEGLPHISTYDKGFHQGEYFASYENVVQYLCQYHNVHIYKGLFPGSAKPIKHEKFSFVHFDVDLYKSTKDALEFFYPRMEKGGIILSHDYGKKGAVGVKRAFDEFYKAKREPVIALTGTQCMVVKI